MVRINTLSEAAILEQIVGPKVGNLSPDAARSFLSFKFDAETTKHIRGLLRKNNRGTISAEERIALEKYLRVGQFIDLLHVKARMSLKEQSSSR